MFKFRQISLTLALVALVFASAGRSADARGDGQIRRSRMMIGLQLYTVRDDCAKDFPGVIKAVAAMGFKGVEFAGYYGRSAEELRKMLDESHLKSYGAHISLDSLQGDNFDKTVEFHRILGTKLLTVASLPDNKRNTKAAIIATAKEFSAVAEKLEKHGMMLAYHNHAAEFQKIEGEYVWDTFFSNADSRVKIQFDTGNALSGGVQAAPFLAKYPGRVVSVHVKDFSATNSDAMMGEGDVNWKEVLPLIRGKAGTKWFIIEQESYPIPPLQTAEKCLRSFEKMLDAK